MGFEPPKHRYTAEEFVESVDECIARCKDVEDDYIACPEQLYLHLEYTPARISQIRNSDKPEEQEQSRALHRWYAFMGVEGFKDQKNGKGTYGATIINRVLKYTEKQVIEQTNLNMEMSEDEKKERLKRLQSK